MCYLYCTGDSKSVTFFWSISLFMKFYTQIIIYGQSDFNPEEISANLNVKFSIYHCKGDFNSRLKKKYESGYAQIESHEASCLKDVIQETLSEYKKIIGISENQVKIKQSDFYIYVETLQGSFPLSTDIFSELKNYFENVEFIIVQETESK